MSKSVSEWQKHNYQKGNNMRNIEKGFKTTQDPWAAHLKKVAERQKKYYSCCKEEYNVRQQKEQVGIQLFWFDSFSNIGSSLLSHLHLKSEIDCLLFESMSATKFTSDS